MTDATNNDPIDEGHPLPESPHVALLIGTLAQNLGIDLGMQNGSYYISKPEPFVFRANGSGLPQLPGAKLHELFHSDDEWRGGIKVVENLLRRLSKADKELVFTLLGSASINPNAHFDFREHLR